jgi:hypothetical protein
MPWSEALSEIWVEGLSKTMRCRYVDLANGGYSWTKLLSLLYFRPPQWTSGQSSWLHDGDVLCFLWGTNWIYICYVEDSRPPLWSSGHSYWLHNGDVLCFLWGTNWIYICYVEESRPPQWSSGQIYWLQIQRSGFYSRRYQIFWELVGLELSLVSKI